MAKNYAAVSQSIVDAIGGAGNVARGDSLHDTFTVRIK